jgi:hypothetical protein
MVKRWYVITSAGPGTRLGIYDNWPEAAEKVKNVRGAIYQGYDTEEEAISVWERARLRAAAAAGVNANVNDGGEAAAQMNGAAPLPDNNNVNGRGDNGNRSGRTRTRTHTGAGSQTHSGVPAANNTTTSHSTRAHTYPSPDPSSQGTSTRNNRRRSGGRSISISSESASGTLHPNNVSVDTTSSTIAGTREPRARTRSSANPPSRATPRDTPTRDQRAHRSTSMRSPELEASRSNPGSVRPHMSVDTSNGSRTRTHANPSGGSSIRTHGSTDASYVTARSERIMSWVAEMSAILPSVPESATGLGTTQTRTPAGARANGVRDEPRRERQTSTPRGANSTRRSPFVPSLQVTVDTSYAISISSSSSGSSEAAQRRVLGRNSRSSRSPRTAPLSPSNSGLPPQSGPEIWVDRRRFASLSPLATSSSYGTPSSSPPTEVTQIDQDPSQTKALSSAGTVPQTSSAPAGTSLSQDAVSSTSSSSPPTAVTQVESLNRGPSQRAGVSRTGSLPQSPSVQVGTSIPRDAIPSRPASPRISRPRTPARSSRETPRAQPQILEQRNSTGSESGSVHPGLVCRCKGICPCCHRLRQVPKTPSSRSSAMNTIGFTEPHHVTNVVDPQTDPRSPIRGGSTRIPAQPGLSTVFARPSPPVSAESSISVLFSTK